MQWQLKFALREAVNPRTVNTVLKLAQRQVQCGIAEQLRRTRGANTLGTLKPSWSRLSFLGHVMLF